MSQLISDLRLERAKVILEHDHWLYVRNEEGCEGFVPTDSCHTEAQISIEVIHWRLLFTCHLHRPCFIIIIPSN